jgi:hypothetical protein
LVFIPFPLTHTLLSRYFSLLRPFLDDIRQAKKKSSELEQWLHQATIDSKDSLSLDELVFLPIQQLTSFRIPLQQLLNASLEHEEWIVENRVTVHRGERDSTFLSELLILLKG